MKKVGVFDPYRDVQGDKLENNPLYQGPVNDPKTVQYEPSNRDGNIRGVQIEPTINDKPITTGVTNVVRVLQTYQSAQTPLNMRKVSIQINGQVFNFYIE